MSSARLEPAQIVRVALMQILQLQQVVVQVAVQLLAPGRLRDLALDADEARPRLRFRDAVEASPEFGGEVSDRVVYVEVQAIVISAREVEHLAQPADTVRAER